MLGGRPANMRCSSDEDEILSDYRRLLELATQRANKVVVSSIPPVMNDDARQELTDSVNAQLTDVCKETGAVMICQDPNFRLANYAANDLLLHKDGIHLSEAGTHRLLQNLDVVSEHSIPSDDRKSTPGHSLLTAQPKTFKIREMYPATTPRT